MQATLKTINLNDKKSPGSNTILKQASLHISENLFIHETLQSNKPMAKFLAFSQIHPIHLLAYTRMNY